MLRLRHLPYSRGLESFGRDFGLCSPRCRPFSILAWGKARTSNFGWTTGLGAGCCRAGFHVSMLWLGIGMPKSAIIGPILGCLRPVVDYQPHILSNFLISSTNWQPFSRGRPRLTKGYGLAPSSPPKLPTGI